MAQSPRQGVGSASYGALGLLLLLILMVLTAPWAGAHGPLADVPVTGAQPGIQNETTGISFQQCLAGGAASKASVVLVAYNNNGSIGVRRSTNGGMTFGATASPMGTRGDPVLAVGPEVFSPVPAPCGPPGPPPPPPHVYLAYVNDAGQGDVVVARSDDGGQTWNAPLPVSPPGGGATDDKPWLAVDFSNDTPYVCWTDIGGGEMVKLKGGAYDNAPISGPQSQFCQIQIDPNPPGKIHLSWYQNPGPNGLPAIMFRTCPMSAPPCGATVFVSTVVRIGRGHGPPDPPGCGVRPYLDNPDPAKRIEVHNAPTLTTSAITAPGGSNAFIIAWNDARYGTADILGRRSVDGGQTWGPLPRPVNSALAGDQFFPAIVAHRSAKLEWYDRREDAANTTMKLYGALSRDGGLTWTDGAVSDVAFQPVTPGVGNRPCYMSDYNGIWVDAIQGGPHFLHVWGDNRGGTPDVFFDLQDEEPPSPPPPPGVIALTQTPSFSLAAGLPSTIPTTGATLHPADVLRRNPSGAPIVGITCANLGLSADGCDTTLPVDDLAALSYGNDFQPSIGDPLLLAFSVAPGSVGLSGTAVSGQAGCSPPEPQADEFVGILDATNVQVFDGNGVACSPLAPSAPPLGLVEPASPPSDDLDALHGRDTTTIAPSGVPLSSVYFTLKPGSPTLAGFSPAHILKTKSGLSPSAFAAPPQLGLVAGDAISDICLREDGDETFDGADLLRFTLTSGSPTLAAIGATAAHVLRPDDMGGLPQPPSIAVAPDDLGLATTDRLDALKCELPLVTDMSMSVLAPSAVAATTGGSPASASVSFQLGNKGPDVTTGDAWLWVEPPVGATARWAAVAGDACVGRPTGFHPDPVVDCGAAEVLGLNLRPTLPLGTTGGTRSLELSCTAAGTFTVVVRTGLRALDPPGAEDGKPENDSQVRTVALTCGAPTSPPPPPPPTPTPPPPPPPSSSPPPPGPGTVRARCVVPNVRGKTLSTARAALVRARCRLGKTSRAYSRKVKRGRVISQKPPPRARRPNRAKVDLVLSRGLRR